MKRRKSLLSLSASLFSSFAFFPIMAGLLSLWGNAVISVLIVSVVALSYYLIIFKNTNNYPSRFPEGLAFALIIICQSKLNNTFHLFPIIVWITINVFLLTSYFARIIGSKHPKSYYKNENIRITFNTTVKLLAYTTSLLFIVLCFKTQLIWLAITAYIIIYLFNKEHDTWEFKWQKKVFDFIATAVIFTGIISTIIQFNDVMVFGLVKLYIFCLVIIGLIVAATIVIVTISAMNNRKERRRIKTAQKKAKVEEERLEQANKTKKNKVKEDILSNNLGLDKLVTVSNCKHQIQWGNDMNLTLEAMKEIAESSYHDKELNSLFFLIDNLKDYIKNNKENTKTVFIGENVLFNKLKEIQSLIKDPELVQKEKEEKMRKSCRKILTDCSEFNVRKEITISNIKRVIFWTEFMEAMFNEMFEVSESSYDDNVLNGIAKICKDIEDYIKSEKNSESLASYRNESELLGIIGRIRKNLN